MLLIRIADGNGLSCRFAEVRTNLYSLSRSERVPVLSRLIARIAIVLAVMLTIVTPGANAQGSPLDLLPYLDGLESAHARRYVNHEHLGLTSEFATPVGEEKSAASFVETTVLEFGAPDDVTAAFDIFVNDALIRGLLGEDEMEYSVSEDVELGDQASLYVVPSAAGDSYSGLLLIQDGNLGLLVSAEGQTDAIQETLMAFGEFMVDAESGGEIVLGNNADSTGGTWEVMPAADDRDILGDLRPIYDYDLLVSNSPIEVPEEATPAA